MYPEVSLHYGDFVWSNFNMADRTVGQLELTLHVSNAGASQELVIYYILSSRDTDWP